MIAPKDNDRIVSNAGLFQRCDHLANLSIDVTRTRQVSMKQSTRQLLADGTVLRYSVASPQLEGSMQAHGCPVLGSCRIRTHRNVIWVVEIPVLFRGDEIQMRLLKAQAEEERLVGVRLEHFLHRDDRQVSVVAILVGLIRNVRALVGRTFDQGAVGILAKAGDLVVDDFPIFLQRVSDHWRHGQRHILRHPIPGRFPAPGFHGIAIFGAVINLARVNGFIAVGPEMLRQGNDVRNLLAEIGVVLDHADSVRTSAGHQTGSRRTANRLLAIRAFEQQAISSEGVQVRRDCDLRSVAAELWAQVVRCYKKDIRPSDKLGTESQQEYSK